jgi:ABC-type Fe3+ transport system permease subunit
MINNNRILIIIIIIIIIIIFIYIYKRLSSLQQVWVSELHANTQQRRRWAGHINHQVSPGLLTPSVI